MFETKSSELRARDDAHERMDDDGATRQVPGGDAHERSHGHPDARRSRLRAILAQIDRSMPTDLVLQRAMRDLVDALALGPEPEVRECPYCGEIVMRAATRCGYCWASLATA